MGVATSKLTIVMNHLSLRIEPLREFLWRKYEASIASATDQCTEKFGKSVDRPTRPGELLRLHRQFRFALRVVAPKSTGSPVRVRYYCVLRSPGCNTQRKTQFQLEGRYRPAMLGRCCGDTNGTAFRLHGGSWKFEQGGSHMTAGRCRSWRIAVLASALVSSVAVAATTEALSPPKGCQQIGEHGVAPQPAAGTPVLFRRNSSKCGYRSNLRRSRAVDATTCSTSCISEPRERSADAAPPRSDRFRRGGRGADRCHRSGAARSAVAASRRSERPRTRMATINLLLTRVLSHFSVSRSTATLASRRSCAIASMWTQAWPTDH